MGGNDRRVYYSVARVARGPGISLKKTRGGGGWWELYVMRVDRGRIDKDEGKRGLAYCNFLQEKASLLFLTRYSADILKLKAFFLLFWLLATNSAIKFDQTIFSRFFHHEKLFAGRRKICNFLSIGLGIVVPPKMAMRA